MTHYQDVLDRLRADKGLAHQRDMIAPTVDECCPEPRCVRLPHGPDFMHFDGTFNFRRGDDDAHS